LQDRWVGDNPNLTDNKNDISKKTILILPASPESIMSSRWREELTKIRGAVDRGNKHIGQFEVQDRPYVSSSDLSQELTRLKPYILHISGCADGVKALVLGNTNQHVDDSNQKELIAELFELHAREVNCLILSGCSSEEQIREIVHNIEFVIGITANLEEIHAAKFLNEFYYQLASNREIIHSYKSGCSLLKREGHSDKATLPLLFTRSDEIKRRDLEKELTSCIKEIEHDQDNIKNWKKKASLLRDLGRTDEANDAYGKAIEIDNTDYKVWWEKAKTHVEAGEDMEAAECYKKALSLLPPSPDDYIICREYGFTLGKLERPYESILLYKTSLCLQPNYRIASHDRKQAYKKIYSKKR
jgi:tetratricopeptide (TPR) repeat protein